MKCFEVCFDSLTVPIPLAETTFGVPGDDPSVSIDSEVSGLSVSAVGSISRNKKVADIFAKTLKSITVF